MRLINFPSDLQFGTKVSAAHLLESQKVVQCCARVSVTQHGLKLFSADSASAIAVIVCCPEQKKKQQQKLSHKGHIGAD